jgi:uncharacterized protein with PQ loop repeat
MVFLISCTLYLVNKHLKSYAKTPFIINNTTIIQIGFFLIIFIKAKIHKYNHTIMSVSRVLK